MNFIKKLKLKDKYYPEQLRQIPAAPKELFLRCGNDVDIAGLLSAPSVAVVGSRKVTPYGKAVTRNLVSELTRAGLVVISGLALGTDGEAHLAALDAKGPTIAVLPCGIEAVYPSSHRHIAKRIIDGGGILLSEYSGSGPPGRESFVARNRIVSGLANGLLIIEAAAKSGTMHTANFALEQGREVMAVPGNITSTLSEGTNNLIKSGATPVTSADDMLRALKYEIQPTKSRTLNAANEAELIILELLQSGISDSDELLFSSEMDPKLFNQTLTMLEITGKIRSLGASQWTLK